MYKWILPSLSEILAESQLSVAECSPAASDRQWCVSLAATEQLLLNTLATNSTDATQGLVLAAPAPMFSQPRVTQSLQTITFTAKPFNPLALMPFQMPTGTTVIPSEIAPHESVLPLLAADPLGREQFCLIFTEKFRLVLVLAEDNSGKKRFSFSFDPEVVQMAWRSLGARVMLNNPDFYAELNSLVQKYEPVAPDYHILMQFSQLLLTQLPQEEKAANRHDKENCADASAHRSSRPDVELLQAFAHEVRTPLTTIRTMTRLLLKQKTLPANVIKRLEVIDHECTEQIDRMELLFKAAELETSAAAKSSNTQLTPTSLDQVLQQSIPRWQQTANRRNLTLDVVLPQQLPTVVSNPSMLDRVLTGLMENFTRSLPAGSHIQVQVIPAGDQLKLQLSPQAQCKDSENPFAAVTPPIRKALGQLLMFQPETGVISLNLSATKHLFQAIGGKLIVRQRPQHGEVLTIFLPLKD
ncbi:HAMP domain-containing histidine kinase [Hassallia byssoidea VB512170]|uniref:histidine kinase n=1 Tax=Hassallia byssoidea VB512170 TaxID=1304833 RepID=A0A846HGD2_9CYAN|nr:HAMP domain-containing histidine kinase [Hassalia byssoidea VB512170]